MTPTSAPIHVFQCSGNTYMHGAFGSNDPWPLQVKAGSFCLLHRYVCDTLVGLRRAARDGGKRLVAKAWGGKFPFQTLVTLATPTLVELRRSTLASAERLLEGSRAEQVQQAVRALATVAEN